MASKSSYIQNKICLIEVPPFFGSLSDSLSVKFRGVEAQSPCRVSAEADAISEGWWGGGGIELERNDANISASALKLLSQHKVSPEESPGRVKVSYQDFCYNIPTWWRRFRGANNQFRFP